MAVAIEKKTLRSKGNDDPDIWRLATRSELVSRSTFLALARHFKKLLDKPCEKFYRRSIVIRDSP